MYTNIGFHKPWVGYLVVDSDVIVGAAGFNGRPENNAVEIFYYNKLKKNNNAAEYLNSSERRV